MERVAVTRATGDIHERFDSLRALRDHANAQGWAERRDDDVSWVGDTRANIQAKMIAGDASLVPAAETLIDRYTANMPETARPYWGFAPVGAFPDVPTFLAGDPACMRARMAMDTSTAPLRVVVDCAASAAVSNALMARRGAAVLAFILAASAIRSVSFEFASVLTDKRHFHAISCPIASHPLDIATAAYVLNGTKVFRGVLIGHASVPLLGHQTYGDDLYPIKASNRADIQRARDLLGLEPSDVFLAGCHAHDPIVANPEQWLADAMVKAHLTSEEE